MRKFILIFLALSTLAQCSVQSSNECPSSGVVGTGITNSCDTELSLETP